MPDFKQVWGNAYVCDGCGQKRPRGYRWRSRKPKAQLCGETEKCKPWSWSSHSVAGHKKG